MIPQIAEVNGILQMTLNLRKELMDSLSDADLAFAPKGNPTLGGLCRMLGETYQSYIDSLKMLKQDWTYSVQKAGELEGSVEKLKAWYTDLDAQMQTVLEGLQEDDQNKLVDRGGFELPVSIQIHTFREALLIFYAKADVYLNMMGKETSGMWKDWIG